jgi:hypothetical protein
MCCRKCAQSVQKVCMGVDDPQKSLQKVCKKYAFHEKKVCKKSAKSLPDADFADSCRLLKKSARVCPPRLRDGSPFGWPTLMPTNELPSLTCVVRRMHMATSLKLLLLSSKMDIVLFYVHLISVLNRGGSYMSFRAW